MLSAITAAGVSLVRGQGQDPGVLVALLCQEEIVREVGGVGHGERLEAKSCGAETMPELVTLPQTTLPVDTPPLVAVKVQSRLSQSSGPAKAAR